MLESHYLKGLLHLQADVKWLQTGTFSSFYRRHSLWLCHKKITPADTVHMDSDIVRLIACLFSVSVNFRANVWALHLKLLNSLLAVDVLISREIICRWDSPVNLLSLIIHHGPCGCFCWVYYFLSAQLVVCYFCKTTKSSQSDSAELNL